MTATTMSSARADRVPAAASTASAVLGTVVSLALIGALGAGFTAAARLTGLDDQATALGCEFPVGIDRVVGEQQPPPLVTLGEYLEQQLGSPTAERQVAQLVADQQVRAVQLGQQPIQAVLLVSLVQLVDQLGRHQQAGVLVTV